MPKETSFQFNEMVIDVFNSIISDYKFDTHEESSDLVIAKKGDINLIFRLESTKLFYYFSLEIKLIGQLGNLAASDPSYRHLGVTAIAKCINPDYKISPKAAQTKAELKELMEIQKEELFNYCNGILLGDLSAWQKTVSCLAANKK